MSVGGGGSTYTLEGRVEASGADAFASQMAGAAGAVTQLRTAVGGAGVALAALSGGALAGAVSAAADFETSMTELEKVTSPETAEAMGDAIMDMASEMPLAQEELAGISEQAGRLGIEGEENISNFTRVVGEMATATDLSAEAAADGLARMTTLMDEPVSNVRSLGDVINELSNTMATSSSEVVEASTRSAASLTNMGASSDEILALNAAMNETSPSARVAGTQLRRLSQELLDPGKVESVSSALGMTSDEFVNMRDNDPTGLIVMMAETMAEGGSSAEALRGSLSSVSRQALAGLSTNLDGLNQALETSKTQFDEGGSLAEEFETAMGTFQNQVQLARNEITNIAISIGNVLLPYLTQLVTWVTSGLQAFQQFNAATNGVAGAVTLLAGLVGGLVTAFAAFWPIISASVIPVLSTAAGLFMSLLNPVTLLTGAVTVATTVLGGLATVLGVLLSPIGLVVAAVVGLVAVFTGQVPQILSTADRVFGQLPTLISNAINSAISWVTGTAIPMLQQAFQTLVERAVQAFTMLQHWIPTRLRLAIAAGEQWLRSTAIPMLQSAFQTLVEQASAAFDWLTTELPPILRRAINAAVQWVRETGVPMAVSAFDFLVTQLLAAWEFTRENIVPPLQTALGTAWTWLRENAPALAQGAFDFLVTQALNAWEFVREDVVPPVMDALGKVWTWLRENAVGLAESAFDFLKTQALNGWEFVREDVVPTVSDAIGKVDTWVRENGVGLVEDAFDWLSTQAVNAWEFATGDGEGGGLVGTVQSAIEGVDSWIRENGVGIAEGAFDWLSTQADNAFDLATGEGGDGGLIGEVRSAVQSMNNWIRETGVPMTQTAFEQLGNAASGLFQNLNLKQQITGAVNGAVSWLQNEGVEQFKQAFRNLGQSIGPALAGMQDTVLNSFKNGVPKIRDWLRNNGADIIKNGWKAVGKAIRTFVVGWFAVGGAIHTAVAEGVRGLKDWLSSGGKEELVQGFNDIVSGIENYLNTQAWSDLKGALEWLFIDGPMAVVEGLYEGLIGNSLIPNMMNDIADFIRNFDLVGAFQSIIDSVMTAVTQWTSDMWNEVNNMASSIVSRISQFGSSVWNSISNMTSSALNAVVSWASSMWNEVSNMANSIVTRISQLGSSVWDAIANMASSVVSRLGQMASDAWNAVDNMASSILTRVQNLGSDMMQAGKDLIDGFIGGINDKLGGVGDAMGGVMDEARSYLPGSDAEQGPLSDLMSTGVALPETFAAGMLDGQRMVERASMEVAGAATPPTPAAVARPPPTPTTTGRRSEPAVDSDALADGVARALGGARIELDTDDGELEERIIDGAELVIGEERKDIAAQFTK